MAKAISPAAKADAAVFREVAYYCEQGRNRTCCTDDKGRFIYDGACYVLECDFNNYDLRKRFYNAFVTDENGEAAFFLAAQLFRDEENAEEAAQEWRALALCFAACLAETGDL